ncbi:hypothetical protein P7C70_g7400, partial [Phenoliferia sp. Uapishka_3]
MPTLTPPPFSRACFSTLPLELKGKIVEMAFYQSMRFEHRIAQAGKTDRGPGYINSVSSLALVNRELRGVAAKYQFEELSSSRVQSLPFRFLVLPNHSHHITHVILEGRDETVLSQTMSLLPQLSALCGLSFTHDSAEILFGPLVVGTFVYRPLEDENPTTYHLGILRSVAPKITALWLKRFPSAAAATLVRCFTNLAQYNAYEASEEQDTDLETLLDALVSLTSLTHLAIDAATLADTTSLDTLRANPPPVRFLQLYYRGVSQVLVDLIFIFGATLETLDLRAPHSSPSSSGTLSASHLPHLTTLILSEKVSDDFDPPTPQLLALLSNTNLISFYYRGVDFSKSVIPTHVLKFVATQKSLRHLQLGSSRPPDFWGVTYMAPRNRRLLPPPSLLMYSDLVKSRDFETSVLEEYDVSPYHPEAELEYTEKELDYLTDALVRTLDFGRNEVGRMVSEGNVAKAVAWVEVLRDLEVERLAWRD